MEDAEIIRLYNARSEVAISETAQKYGNYCHSIAMNILSNEEDAEESVNDTWYAAWQSIPPQRPQILSAFLARLTRNFSLDRWRKLRAFKRGGGEVALALEELRDCVSGKESVEGELIRRETLRSINCFLGTLTAVERSVFLCRYWYLDSSQEIAAKSGFSETKVRSMLRRLRIRLDKHLEKEGLR